MSVVGSIEHESNATHSGVLGWNGQHLLGSLLVFIPGISIDPNGETSIGEIRIGVAGIDPSDGSRDWFILPSESWGCSDITWDGESYFASGTGHVTKLSQDGANIEKFSVPGRPNAKLSGIAWDGSHFWVSDQPKRIRPRARNLRRGFTVAGWLTLKRAAKKALLSWRPSSYPSFPISNIHLTRQKTITTNL